MTKRVGYLVPEFPSQTHVFFWREVTALRDLGVVVDLISTRKPAMAVRHEFAVPAGKETQYLFPPGTGAIVTLARSPKGTAQALRYLARLSGSSPKLWLRRLALLWSAAELLRFARRQRLGHVHVHSCADAAHIAALCRLLGGPPYSLTLHGDLPVYGKDHSSKMKGAACITCAGPHLVQPIIEQGVAAERVLPNGMGVDTDLFCVDGRRQFLPNKLHLVTVARLDLCKGHRYALAGMQAALEEGCDLHYTIVGDGPDRDAIVAEIDRLKLLDRVSLVGTRSEAEVLDLLQTADTFVLTSVGLGEAWPVSLMEAMSCGLPAVCSIIGSTSHMVDDGVNGLLVEQRDIAALAQSFVHLAHHPEKRRRLGEAARAHAVEHFDHTRSAQRLLQFIDLHTGNTCSQPELRVAPLRSPTAHQNTGSGS